jgi:hypothetical protein
MIVSHSSSRTLVEDELNAGDERRPPLIYETAGVGEAFRELVDLRKYGQNCLCEFLELQPRSGNHALPARF